MFRTPTRALAVVALFAPATAICPDNPAAVHLGDAGKFAILAKSGISTVPQSTITGDIAVSPITGAAMTGFSETADSSGTFATSAQVSGRMYGANYVAPTPAYLTNAVYDMEAAYTEAAGRPRAVGERLNLGASSGIGGKTLTGGVYTWGVDVLVYSDIYLDGSPEDVFILQTSGNLIIDANVVLLNGVQASNVFWQVAGYIWVGAGAHLEGILLAKTKVVFITGSSLNGRILTQTAATLGKAIISEPNSQAVDTSDTGLGGAASSLDHDIGHNHDNYHYLDFGGAGTVDYAGLGEAGHYICHLIPDNLGVAGHSIAHDVPDDLEAGSLNPDNLGVAGHSIAHDVPDDLEAGSLNPAIPPGNRKLLRGSR